MSDVALRRAQRDDPITTLAWRLRTDAITHERVACAAMLGHESALQVAESVELAATPRLAAKRGAKLLGQVEAVRWAADVAEQAVERVWTNVSDRRPAEAIAAARAWMDCPCENHAKRAAAAVYAATEDAEYATTRSGDTERSAASVASAASVPSWAGTASWAVYWAVCAGAITWDEALADLAERLLA